MKICVKVGNSNYYVETSNSEFWRLDAHAKRLGNTLLTETIKDDKENDALLVNGIQYNNSI